MIKNCVRVIAAAAAVTVALYMPGAVYAAGAGFEQETEKEAEETEAEEEFPGEELIETETENEPAELEEPEEETEPEEEPGEETETGEEPEETGQEEELLPEEPEEEPPEESAEKPNEEYTAEEPVIPAMPCFDAEGRAGSISVRIHAEEGILPEGARAEIRELTSQEKEGLLEEAEALSGEAVAVTAVDITFLDRNGEEIQPLGMVQVSFLDAVVYDKITVLHSESTDSGSLERIEAKVEGDDVVFENDHFSPYLLMAAASSPDWTQGGAGTMRNVGSEVSLVLRDTEWSNYHTWGRGYSSYQTDETTTVRYNVYYKGKKVGVASCINPQLDGDYADGRTADAVYEVDAPMLVKALYYGNSGPRRDVVQSVYNMNHDPSEDKNNGGPEVLTHVAVSEIYARLYPSMSKTGPGRGFSGPTTALLKNDVNAFVSRLNSLPVPDNYVVYIAHYNADVQDFAMTSVPLGNAKFSIKKSSAELSVTEGNTCYDLTGAVYWIYTSEKEAREKGDAGYVGKLQTKGDGSTDLWEGPPGTYYIIEGRAPKGYLPDDTVYRVNAAAGKAEVVQTADRPAVSLLPLVIRKENRIQETQKGRSLAGTLFEVRYYQGYYTAESLPGQPDRTWQIRTAETEEGECRAELNEEAEGDPLFVVDGTVGIPLGTVTVSEKEPAPGYKNDQSVGGTNLYIGHISLEQGKETVTWTDLQGKREDTGKEETELLALDTPLSPEIRTRAKNDENGSSFCMADDEVKICDTVTCKNLIPGENYILSGRLVDKATGETILDKDGKKVLSEMTFTASESQEETVEMQFVFAADDSLAGKTTVVFESVRGESENVPGAVHEQPEDEAQTIRFPGIRTTARDRDTGFRVASALGEQTIIDEVRYENLTPGEEYTLRGTLVNRKSGEPLCNAELVFAAEKENGTVQIEFSCRTEELTGEDLAVLEELYLDEELIAAHADPEDEEQIVHIPAGSTAAAGSLSGNRNCLAGEKCVIKDTFSYRNLLPGVQYRLCGSLHHPGTGEELEQGAWKQTDENGKEIQEAVFTPGSPDGSVVIYLQVDARGLAGKDLVVFEQLCCGEKLLLSHEDPGDEAQTIHFPSLMTDAADLSDGDRSIAADGTAEIVDHVTYKNLVPGIQYRVAGCLMSKKTGAPARAAGKEIRAETAFTAEESDGSVDVHFSLDAAKLAPGEYVVFEELYGPGTKLAVHQDINAGSQTVNKEKAPSGSPKTADDFSWTLWALVSAAALTMILAAAVYCRKRQNPAERDILDRNSGGPGE